MDRNIAPYFESLDKGQQGRGRRQGIFEPSEFVYNPDEDLFICPAGEFLEPRKRKTSRNQVEYSAIAKTCRRCSLEPRCTRSKQGRTLKRQVRQDELDRMLSTSESRQAKGNIRKRQHLMERSFVRSDRFGYHRARWRRLWGVQIQEYLTASIQNIMVLIRNVKEQSKAAAASLVRPGPKRPSFKNIIFTFEVLAKVSRSFLTLEPC